jgi:hypothetical protein
VRRRRAKEFALATTAHPVDQAGPKVGITLELGRQASEKLISVLWLERASQIEDDVEFFIAEGEHAAVLPHCVWAR